MAQEYESEEVETQEVEPEEEEYVHGSPTPNAEFEVFGEVFLTDDNGELFMKRVMVDEKETWELLANKKYKLNGNYYETDDKARIVRYIKDKYRAAEPGPRGAMGFTVDGLEEGDHRGHLDPYRDGGLNSKANAFAQAGKFNQGVWKQKENRVRELGNDGHDIGEIVNLYFEDDSRRPDYVEDFVRVDGNSERSFYPNSNDAYAKSPVTNKMELVKPADISEDELDYDSGEKSKENLRRIAEKEDMAPETEAPEIESANMEPETEVPAIEGADLTPDDHAQEVTQDPAVNMEPAVTKGAIAEDADPTPAVSGREKGEEAEPDLTPAGATQETETTPSSGKQRGSKQEKSNTQEQSMSM